MKQKIYIYYVVYIVLHCMAYGFVCLCVGCNNVIAFLRVTIIYMKYFTKCLKKKKRREKAKEAERERSRRI